MQQVLGGVTAESDDHEVSNLFCRSGSTVLPCSQWQSTRKQTINNTWAHAEVKFSTKEMSSCVIVNIP